MIYIWLNIVPIGLATLVALAIGAVWMAASGLERPGGVTMLLAVLALFWLAAILAGALILAPAKAAPWTMALGSAFIIWVGFVLPVLAVTLSMRGARAATILSAAGYWLVTMLAQATLMMAIGLVSPPA